MNAFGGGWTEQKSEILVAYAKDYSTAANAGAHFKSVNFDSFANPGIKTMRFGLWHNQALNGQK
ncbi:MAG: hypothetical protein ABI416_05965 [Ginsengibacter sp.]